MLMTIMSIVPLSVKRWKIEVMVDQSKRLIYLLTEIQQITNYITDHFLTAADVSHFLALVPVALRILRVWHQIKT